MIRNILSAIQSIVFTIAQFYLSQPIIQIINCTGPLKVFILDYFINKTTITMSQFYGVLIGVAGALLTINGEVILKHFDPSYESKS